MALRRLLAVGGDVAMALYGVAGVLIGVELEAVELEEVELDLLANCIESGLPVESGLPRPDNDPPPILLCLDDDDDERCGFKWKSSGAGSVGDERSRVSEF